MGSGGITLGDDPQDLFELLHQRYLGMQTARGVDNQDLNTLCGSGSHGLEDHRGGIRARQRRGDGYLIPLTPRLQLFNGRRPEGIRRGQSNRSALLPKTVGQLADRGVPAGAVYADYQYHKGSRAVFGDHQRTGHGLQYTHHLLSQGLVEEFRITQLLATQIALHVVDDPGSRLYAHICAQHQRLDLLDQVLIAPWPALNEAGKPAGKAFTGTLQPLFQAFEESFRRFRLSITEHLGSPYIFMS